MSTKVKEVEEDPLDLKDDLHDDLNDLLPLRIRVEIKFRRRESEGFRYRRMYDENVRRRIGIALKRDVFAKEKDVEFIFLRNPNWNTEVGIVATGVLMMTTDKSRVEIEVEKSCHSPICPIGKFLPHSRNCGRIPTTTG